MHTRAAYRIILFYRFARVPDPHALRERMHALAQGHRLTGRMLIATEGVNATFEGAASDIDAYTEALRADPWFAEIVFKTSDGTGSAFPKLSVKVRPEIVTLGAGEFDVQSETAPAVTAEELERWYQDDADFVVLDLRNDYEIQAGRFERTVDPGLRNFRDLPQKIAALAPLAQKKIVAVCTGGIRCEKATCLLRRHGFENLYQLKDGIHTYIERHPGKRFKGTLYVFDNRMATVVTDAPTREVIGRCAFCAVPTEDILSDDSYRPSRKVLCCSACAQGKGAHLRASAAR